MNLYMVGHKDSVWVCFCFAPNPNKAKYMVARALSEDYVDLRYSTIQRGSRAPYAAVVDDRSHPLYPLVEETDHHYMTLEQMMEEDACFET